VWVAVLGAELDPEMVRALARVTVRESELVMELEKGVVLAEDSVKERAMEWAVALEVESETMLGNPEVSPSQRK